MTHINKTNNKKLSSHANDNIQNNKPALFIVSILTNQIIELNL